MNRHLSPAETAKRFGISIKALRLYESRGLLTPLRTASGSTGAAWRAYGPDQIARLHQILALKRLGLPLARIGEILSGADRLEPVLALQERVLVQDGERVSRALALVRAARAKLAAGQALSIDDLANLNKETVMQTTPSKEEIENIKVMFAPLVAKHFTPEEACQFLNVKNSLQAEMAAFRELVEAAMAKGDPAPALAQEIARRYRAIGQALSGGDAALLEKISAFRKEAQQNPDMARMMLLTPQMQAYVDRTPAPLHSH
jgi:DNA-binding transcriptional MerR regulator